MGSPTFYWYPKEGGSLEKSAITRSITRLEADDRPQADDSYGGSQAMTRVFHGTRRRVRIEWERLNLLSSSGAADYRSLLPIIAHLQRGHAVGFSADAAKTIAGYPGAGNWSRGASSLTCASNLNAFRQWQTAAALTSGDQVVIESSPDYGRGEQRSATSFSAGVLTLASQKLVFDYAGADPMWRWYWFWPALRLPLDQLGSPLVTNDHGITATVQFVLEVDPTIHLLSTSAQGGQFGLGDLTARGVDVQPTLDSLLASSRIRTAARLP